MLLQVWSNPAFHYDTPGPVSLKLRWNNITITYSGNVCCESRTAAKHIALHTSSRSSNAVRCSMDITRIAFVAVPSQVNLLNLLWTIPMSRDLSDEALMMLTRPCCTPCMWCTYTYRSCIWWQATLNSPTPLSMLRYCTLTHLHSSVVLATTRDTQIGGNHTLMLLCCIQELTSYSCVVCPAQVTQSP